MQAPFVGRQKYLERLNHLLNKKSASLVVIRGRRRIGKSRLVEEFAKGKSFFSFSGLAPEPNTTAQMQRDEFARQLERQVKISDMSADDWGNLFTLLAEHTSVGRHIIFLDEITWMGSLDPAFMGKLKIVWDLHFSKNPELILILCGSVSAWIEKNIISSTGFFGRISLKILLTELSLPHCNQLLVDLGFLGSTMEKLMLLSVTGGVPWYLEQINPKFSALENIKQLCFINDGLLLDEFRNIFHDLFGKKSEIYERIITVLVEGPAEYNQIAQGIQYPSGGPLSEYLEELVLSGYISKDNTWSLQTGKEKKVVRYRLSDNYLRFYLRYIEPNYHKIQSDLFELTSITNLPGFNSIMGLQIENLVLNNRSLIYKALKLSPQNIIYDNPYYQRATTALAGCQIDYLIQTRFHRLYACEIKFSDQEISTSVVPQMQAKINCLGLSKRFYCMPVLIHANGISQAVKDVDYFAYTIDLGELLEA